MTKKKMIRIILVGETMKNQVQSQTEDLGLEKRGQVWIPQDVSLLGSGDQNGEVEAEKSFLQVTLTFIIR